MPAFEMYLRNDIDEAELARRKSSARVTAMAEDAALDELNRAYKEYSAAVMAEDAAVAAREAAAVVLMDALRPLEMQQLGHSKRVKTEGASSGT